MERVYLGRNNPVSVRLQQDSVDISLRNANRMVLTLDDLGMTLDTDIDPTLITWGVYQGVVEFNLNFLAISSGTAVSASLTAFDRSSGTGVTLVSNEEHILRFLFI